jgi:catechol 2,3-dioxygenase-like lactoylglutathione lyase family enzyme
LKQAIPNVFVKDFQAALAYYTGPLGFHPLFVYGEFPFYAHVARDEAISANRHVTRHAIDHTAGEDLLSAFIEVSDVCTTPCEPLALTSASHRATSLGPCVA